MRRIKPLYLMHEEGVTTKQINAVLDGIRQMLDMCGMTSQIEIHNFGVWRHGEWRKEGKLIPWKSVDWYIQRGREESVRRDQLDGNTIIYQLYGEPWQDPSKGGQPHYDVVVLKSDMYADDTNFVIGVALPEHGTVISIHRFLGLRDQVTQIECIKTETMHEIGHVFGLVPEERTENVEESLGKHCTNICVMRQGLRLPNDWIRITHDRLNQQALCRQCQKDLRAFFASPQR